MALLGCGGVHAIEGRLGEAMLQRRIASKQR